jgi:hypothetical protein
VNDRLHTRITGEPAHNLGGNRRPVLDEPLAVDVIELVCVDVDDQCGAVGVGVAGDGSTCELD